MVVVFHRWPTAQTVAGALVGSNETVDARRHIEIGPGETALGVRGELEANLVPAVHVNVGVMVGHLGGVGDTIDKRDRLREVLKGKLPHNRPPVAPPLTGGKAIVDLRIGEECHGPKDTRRAGTSLEKIGAANLQGTFSGDTGSGGAGHGDGSDNRRDGQSGACGETEP